MSVTSSLTPLMVENSCATPSMRTLVTAAPGPGTTAAPAEASCRTCNRSRGRAARATRRRRNGPTCSEGCSRSASSARCRWPAGASCSSSSSRSSATSRITPGDRFARQATTQGPRGGDEGSRWNPGKDLSFVPLRPERVLEVRYDHMEGTRFRHPPQFVRWRPDREPGSCGYAQLERPVRFEARGRAGRTRGTWRPAPVSHEIRDSAVTDCVAPIGSHW